MKNQNENHFLRSATRWQKKVSKTTTTLDKEVDSFLRTMSHKAKKQGQVVDLWNKMMNNQLRRHCKLSKIQGGVVEIGVEPGAYMHEMQMCKADVLKYIQENCPASAIRMIRLINAEKIEKNGPEKEE